MQVLLPKTWNTFDFASLTIDVKIKKKKIKKSNYLEDGKHPIIDQSKKKIAGYTNDSAFIYAGKLPVIIFGDHTLCVKFIDFPFAIGADGAKVIHVNEKKCTPKFLYYSIINKNLKSEGYKRHYAKLCIQKFITPQIPEQQRISKILTDIDNAIENIEQIIEKTQFLKEALMQKLFTEGIGHDKFTNTVFGKIPKVWIVSNIGKEFDVRTGGTPSRMKKEYYGGTIPWLKSAEINYRVITDAEEKITDLALKKSSAKKYPKGTLIMAMLGQGKTRGQCAILGIDAAISQSMAALKPISNNVDTLFCYYYLQYSYERIRIGQGRDRSNLSCELIKKILISFPSTLHEQQKIASILSNMDKKIKSDSVYKTNLERLKKGLMQKLLTGQIRVKV